MGKSLPAKTPKALLVCVGVLAGFILLLLSAELTIRLCIHVLHGAPGKSYGINQPDPELGAVHRPNSYNTNSLINNWGFRNSEDIRQEKPAGSTRIYCSGGSTTFCYNLLTEEAWPSVLQAKLRKITGHERDEVLNAGEICFSVSQEFTLAKRFVPQLKPDVVILMTGINEWLSARTLEKENTDFDRLLREEKWGVFSRNLDQGRFLKRNSALVRFVEYRVLPFLQSRSQDAFRQQERPSWFHLHPWVVKNFDHTLRDYIAFLKANGCKVVVIRYGDNGDTGWYSKVLRFFRDQATDIGRDEGAVICDLASLAERHPNRKDLYVESGFHVTREGAQVVADEILRVLLN